MSVTDIWVNAWTDSVLQLAKCMLFIVKMRSLLSLVRKPCHCYIYLPNRDFWGEINFTLWDLPETAPCLLPRVLPSWTARTTELCSRLNLLKTVPWCAAAISLDGRTHSGWCCLCVCWGTGQIGHFCAEFNPWWNEKGFPFRAVDSPRLWHRLVKDSRMLVQETGSLICSISPSSRQWPNTGSSGKMRSHFLAAILLLVSEWQ